MGVFQRTFLFAGRSKLVGGNCPSTAPDAPGPRNCGQLAGLVTAPVGSGDSGSFSAGLALAVSAPAGARVYDVTGFLTV